MDKGQAIHCNSTAITTWASNHCPRLQRTPAFANAAGAIDGCHIRIKGPGNQHRADYINYKLFLFIQRPSVMQETDFLMYLWAIQAWYMMQGVCAMVFYKALYPPPWRLPPWGWCPSLPENTIGLLTPYKHPLHGRVQERFNLHRSRARSVVERAFGMMKTCWQATLLKAAEVRSTFAPGITTCCAFLHNLWE